MARIFQADDSVRSKGRAAAKLLVVKTPAKEAFVHSLVEALGPTQIVTQEVTVADLAAVGGGLAAIYVADSADAAAVQKFCVEHGVLSVAGDTTLADQGLVAVALGTSADNHPEIAVNVKQLAAQHHVLAAPLLKLARLIDG